MTKSEFKQQAALALLSNTAVHDYIVKKSASTLCRFTDEDYETFDLNDHSVMIWLQQKAIAYHISGIVEEMAVQLGHD